MESFEQVTKLDTPALRELFAAGRAEQRMWAIWALALRTGGIVGVAGAAGDPDAGVRRTIAVMLAGHGEHDMLIALARQDRAPAVRESAMQLVTRLASQGVIEPEIVLEAAREDPPVRGAILAAIDRGAPAFLVELAMEWLRGGTASEQADAFEALIRTESREVAHAALAWLETLPNVPARDACARMVRALGDYAFASELAQASRRVRVLAVGVMHQPSWPAVELLIGDDFELLLAIVREGRIHVPLTAIARAALDGQATPLVERLTADLALLEAPSDELRPLLPLLERHYAEWIAVLDEADDDHEYARERTVARKRLEKLRRQLQRLLRS